jgi:hypothetical protein
MNTSSRLRWIAPALVAVFLSGPAFAAAGLPESGVPITAPAQAPAPVQTTPKPAPAPTKATATQGATEDSARYAQRAQQSKDLENFKGGEGVSIYIGSTVLAVALLVVLLLVLI